MKAKHTTQPARLIVNHATPPTKHRASSSSFLVNCAATRHETFDGRDYLVAPVVAVKEGVLNGMLVQYDEFAAYPQAWEGVPLPIYHPMKGQERVTANTPDVLQKQVVGRLFNVHVDANEKALKGELWIDVAKAGLTDDGNEIVRRLEAAEALEVSTGYFSDLELTSGFHSGKPYDSIQRNMRPDHLALLPGKKGACSWMDGCGAPRLNEPITNNSTVTNAVKYLVKDEKGVGHLPVTGEDGKPDHRLMGAAWAALHSGYRGNQYAGPGKAKALAKLKSMYRREKMDPPAANQEVTSFHLTGNQNDYSHSDIEMMIRESLMEEDQGCYYYISDVFDDFFVYTAESKSYVPPPASPAGLFKRTYTLTDGDITLGGAVPAVRKTSYVEVTENEEQTMDKKAIIDKILATPGTTWKEEHRATMMTINEAELSKLLPPDPTQVAAEAATAARKTIVDKLISDKRTSWKEDNRATLMTINDAQLTALLPVEEEETKKPIFANAKAFLESIPDPAIRKVIEQGLAVNERRKTQLVAALIANKACKFTQPELEAMDVEFLEKVADSMSVTYVGAAPPRQMDRARVENEDQVPDPPKFLTAPITAK